MTALCSYLLFSSSPSRTTLFLFSFSLSIFTAFALREAATTLASRAAQQSPARERLISDENEVVLLPPHRSSTSIILSEVAAALLCLAPALGLWAARADISIIALSSLTGVIVFLIARLPRSTARWGDGLLHFSTRGFTQHWGGWALEVPWESISPATQYANGPYFESPQTIPTGVMELRIRTPESATTLRLLPPPWCARNPRRSPHRLFLSSGPYTTGVAPESLATLLSVLASYIPSDTSST